MVSKGLPQDTYYLQREKEKNQSGEAWRTPLNYRPKPASPGTGCACLLRELQPHRPTQSSQQLPKCLRMSVS